MNRAWSIGKQNFFGYFRNPTGVVFVTIFVLLEACFQFVWRDEFFLRNLATLDPLNQWFLYLLLFLIPSISMGTWAEERKLGTEELLMTLPVSDRQLVLGKYLGCLAVYLVAVVLSLSHVGVLAMLGNPDPGLVGSNYIGYALVGGGLLAVGMIGSFCTESATVGFILGAILCAAFVFAPSKLGIRVPFSDFAGGVVTLQGVFYAVALAGVALYVNLALLAHRRRGRTGDSLVLHHLARAASLLVLAGSVYLMIERTGIRWDLTSERLHSLSPQTLEILKEVRASKRPVYVQAFVSPQVPPSYVPARESLLSLLREFDARGGGRLLVKVYPTELYSDEARQAEERFGIRAERVFGEEEGRFEENQVYLGVSFASGPEEVVIPFMHRGLSVEYELARSLRVVSRADRSKLGVLRTDAKLFGGFDFNRMSSSPEWSVVAELKKQYEVTEVSPDEAYPADLDVLMAALPSSLTEPQMERVVDYVATGKPVLILEDPLPMFDPSLAASEPRGSGQNPFTMGGRPPPEPKGDILRLFDRMGIRLPVDQVIWDAYNPHPEFSTLPPEFVFVGRGSGSSRPFNPDEMTTVGLQEVVLLYPGQFSSASPGDLRFTPLLSSGPASGYVSYQDIFQRSFFGFSGLNPSPRRAQTFGDKVLAARVKGPAVDPMGAPVAEGAGIPKGEIDAIVVADLDLISEQFFDLRRRGVKGLHFDNVTFVLNAVDVLAGDESFVALRNRRPRHRTLERVEDRVRAHTEGQQRGKEEAEREAQKQLDAAQKRLDEKVQALRERQDLDERARAIMIENLEAVENRRLEVARHNIEDQKNRAIEMSRIKMEQEVRRIQRRIQWISVLVFPVPAVLLALGVMGVRIRRSARMRVQEERG
jgi:ABC-2 type transport system permease protein